MLRPGDLDTTCSRLPLSGRQPAGTPLSSKSFSYLAYIPIAVLIHSETTLMRQQTGQQCTSTNSGSSGSSGMQPNTSAFFGSSKGLDAPRSKLPQYTITQVTYQLLEPATRFDLLLLSQIPPTRCGLRLPSCSL